MPYNSIDEILSELEKIIAASEKSKDRVGYFAALYYKVTLKVKEGITRNEFENGPRMEKLDVLFASRYLDALQQWRQGSPLTKSWKVAFDATRQSSLLVLQQLLLGMNAHINLDLGIAAVETVQNQSLDPIQKDFDAINTIISSLTYQVIHEINRISPLLSLIGLNANNTDSLLIQFSIDNARDGAWCFAEELHTKQGPAYGSCIQSRDKDIAKLAGALIKSSGLIRLTLWVVHVFEWKNPKKIIHILHTYKKKFMRVHG
jgi:hypothetical protein